MIVWLNGPFGAGKTTTTQALLEARPGWGVFDTENVGVMLRPALARRRPVPDFQDWAAWRTVSVAALVAVAAELDSTVVVPQTVVVEDYWRQLSAGVATAGLELRAVTLHVDPDAHERRIAGHEGEGFPGSWRRERRADYDAALPWLRQATTVIDTSELTPVQVTRAVLEEIDPADG